jgi:hypothetical protein
MTGSPLFAIMNLEDKDEKSFEKADRRRTVSHLSVPAVAAAQGSWLPMSAWPIGRGWQGR